MFILPDPEGTEVQVANAMNLDFIIRQHGVISTREYSRKQQLEKGIKKINANIGTRFSYSSRDFCNPNMKVFLTF